MKFKKIILIIFLVVVPWTFSTSMMISLSYDKTDLRNIGLFTSNGVSKYNVSQSVKYQVEINYTLTHTSFFSQDYYFKVARLNDRQPNSPITPYCPPYQESKLLYNSITGYDIIQKGSLDKFNNTYDQFNATPLFQNEKITISQKYNITLNAVTFQDIDDSDIGAYNMSDDIFDLYCNNTEDYYERDNGALIAASNSIVDVSDNYVEKAEKICNWVSSYLTYDGSLPPEEMGALWAYNNGRGDCSEYSSLMVTLLRIQGIPARKVTGICISNNPNLKPTKGQVFNFYLTSGGLNNFMGHAWVEYYVEDIGWIACDPTWHSGGYDYFNRIDYLRLNTNIGAWFFLPGASPGYDYISEFPPVPAAVTSNHDAYTFDHRVRITVVGGDLLPSDFNILIIYIVAGCAVVALLGVIYILIRRTKKRPQTY